MYMKIHVHFLRSYTYIYIYSLSVFGLHEQVFEQRLVHIQLERLLLEGLGHLKGHRSTQPALL